jgi:hypothetical protein
MTNWLIRAMLKNIALFYPLAITNPQIFSAPAVLKTRAVCSRVEPVAAASSSNKIFLPFKFSGYHKITPEAS